MEYKNEFHVCEYYVVWCPKYRRKVLTGLISERLKELIKQKCSEIKADIIQLEIMPDHVQMVMTVNPEYGISKTIKAIKSHTSHVLRNEFKELTTKIPSMWTNNYFVSTLGNVSPILVQHYIESQKNSQRK